MKQISQGIRSLVLVFFLGLTVTTFGQETLNSATWLPAVRRSLDFFNVGQLARHQWFSRSIVVSVQLASSIDLGQFSSESGPEMDPVLQNRVGLTNSGVLYQVSQIPSSQAKTGSIWIGRVLSGDRIIKDFAISNSGLLVASDAAGRLYVFDNQKWHRSPISDHWRSGLKSWALSMMAFFAGSAAVISATDQNPEILYLIGPLVGLGVATFHVIREHAKFDPDNLAPSGLEEVRADILSVDRPTGSSLAAELNKLSFELNDELNSELKLRVGSAGGDWTPPCEKVLVKSPPDAYIDRRRL